MQWQRLDRRGHNLAHLLQELIQLLVGQMISQRVVVCRPLILSDQHLLSAILVDHILRVTKNPLYGLKLVQPMPEAIR